MSFKYQLTETVSGHTTGNNLDIDFTWDYLDESDIEVFRTDTSTTALELGTNFNFQLKKRIRILSGTANVPAIENGHVFIVRRTTKVDDAFITYASGSPVRAEDLNDNQKQVLFSAQEREERSISQTGGKLTGDLNIEAANLVFEGATADDHETILTVVEPTADQTYRLPNLTAGTYDLISTGDTDTVTSDMLTNNIDIAGTLDVTGNTTLDGSLSVATTSTFTGNVTANGNIDLAGDIDVDGTANLDNVDIDGTIHAASTSTFVGAITASGGVVGNVTGNVSGTATNATHVNVTDNEDTDENNLITFIENASATGNVGLESDGDFHYNPNSGTVTATTFAGNVTGNVTGDILSPDGTTVLNNGTGNGTNSTFSGNANTATTLANTRTIAGNNFNGSDNVTISLNQLSDVNVGTPGSGQDDQVLAWDNANNEFALTTVSSGSGGISDVVDDSTPQLGGNLDTNEKEITSASNRNVIINPHGTGLVELGANLDLKGNEIVSTDNASIVIQPSGNGDVIINDDRTTSCHYYVKSGDVENALFVNGSSGRVGIGTNAPGNPLHVAGAAQVDGNVIVTDGNNLQLNPTGNPSGKNLRINADDLTTSYNLTMPPAPGTANQVLRIDTIDGSNNTELKWETIDTSGASTSNIAVNTPTTIDAFTIAANRNVGMMGPLTVNDGETITIGSGSKLVILN